MKLLEERLDLESITVMIQKEVADRLIATPGEKETGAITYTVYYYATAQGVIEVQNNAFIPEPEVTSKVITLKIRKNPPVEVKDKKLREKLSKNAYKYITEEWTSSIAAKNLIELFESIINKTNYMVTEGPASKEK